MFILFHGLNPILLLFILLLKLFRFWPLGAPSGWILCSFDKPHFLKHFLVFWYHKVFQVHLVLGWPKSSFWFFCKVLHFLP